MIRWLLLLWALALFLPVRSVAAQSEPAAALPAAPAAQPIAKLPASAFARLPFIETPKLSPSGTFMAGLVAINGAQQIAMMPVIGDRKGTIIIGVPDMTEVTSIRWVNDDHIIVRLTALLPVESDRWYVSRYIGVSRATGTITRLLWDMAGQGADLLWVPHDGSTEVLIAAQDSIYSGEGFWPAIYRVDVTNGKRKMEEKGRTDFYGWGTDRHGRVRFATSYRDNTTRSRLLYRGEAGGLMRTAERAVLRDDEELTYPLEFIDNSDNALVLAENDAGKSIVVEQNMATREKVRDVFTPEKGEAEGIWTSHDGSRLLGVFTSDQNQPIVWVDPAMAAHQHELNATSPKSRVSIVSVNADESKMLVRISTPDNPGLLFHFDSKSGSLMRLAAYNDVIGGKRLSRARLVQYKARDGLEIEAVLTLPRGQTAKSLPFIVMPHGGPWAHDELGYDYWAQYLAELGYGVIQPNFRGSTGYGEDFLKKGEGQIGLAMQDDKSDALAWAVSEGIADPARVCIVGASYGGYAAMWGIAKEPDLYRCAISIAGVSNMRKEASDFGGSSRENLYRSQWARMSNDFAAVSPINSIDRIKAPLLLIHGKKDVTVDHGQSARMDSAMRRAGKSVEYLALPLADHFFTREADRLALLESMGAFLRQHNPPD